MSKVAELNAKIAQLEKERNEIINAERKSVIDDIRAKLVTYNISLDELGRKGKAVKSATKTPSPIKYRKSEHEYWVGRGPKPQWVKAIEAAGESIELYRIPE
ncbi:H-NS histone family protein [Chlorobium ferrooxidans]|uniref:Histone-like nucleoid-structuring protein H-NS n=1 Tax=Chlorobium ferrooxidans DSM 13031 TaxID=377431 RepID=Q0YV23_9CHLB|nr:H-NS histone family protein [Chlorobium ferrooxidans]EAT59873.1 Histone-like nucleoid-structuring protein H-NS [Chlorobium ferrooxidans DSM 13031]